MLLQEPGYAIPSRLVHGVPIVWFALPLLLSCQAPAAESSPDTTPTPQVDASDVQVAVHGCELIVEPGVRRCLLGGPDGGPSVVSLWVADHYELRHDGRAIAARTLHEPEGTLLRVEIAEPRGTLELVHEGKTRWSLELAPTSAEYRTLIERTLVRANEGDLEAAAALLDEGMADLDTHEAALTRCLAAQLAYGSDRLPAIIEDLRTSPAIGCRGHAHVIAAHGQLYESPDLNGAQANLAQAGMVAPVDFLIQINLLFHQADLDLMVGRIDEALASFDRVIRLATLVEERDVLRSAQVMKAIALARLGRFGEAEQLVELLEAALVEGDENDEVVLGIRYNLAWAALLRRETDPRGAVDPTATLERLAKIYSEHGDATHHAGTQLHLALAAIQNGDVARAQAALARVDRSELAPFELVWLELVASRTALRAGDRAGAREQLDRAHAFAQLTEDRELDWLVWTANASLARLEGQDELALAAHEQAARLADQLALAVPGSAGRSMLVTSHGRVDAEHVELLLELERPESALCVAAGSRARHLRTLWARLRPSLSAAEQHEYRELLSRHESRRKSMHEQLEQAWMLSTIELEQLHARLRSEGEQIDELLTRATALLEREAPQWSCEQILPRAPEQALLTMIADAHHRRWWFMLARGGRAPQVVVLAVDGSAEQLARQALLALEPALVGVERLDVIPIGEFVGVDLQRSMFERPSLATVVLRYSLGLGYQREAGTRELERRASVVAGATDLAAVTQEAARVAETLRAHDWRVDPSWSPTAAEQPTLLHYSGHGHHTGLAGWRSYIEVPGFGPLTAAGLVAMARAPNLVVLGACSAGSSDAEIIDGGMNLAAAFLLAGAELVVAPSGPVDDATALALAGDLYRDFVTPDIDALVRGLVERQREELDAAIEPGPRSTLRWRAWVP
jgi:tetratricopeptide (TPR) repeat protein